MNSAMRQRVRRRSFQQASSHVMSEVLVSDPRGDISPAQMVENKLCSILGGSALRLSDMRLVGLPRDRGRR